MLTLVVNTTGKANQLATFDQKTKLAEYISKKFEKHSGTEKLKSITQNLLKKAKKNITKIDLIIVVLGPGSYTGSRSGLAFTKAISHATDIDLVGISLFDVFANITNPREFPFTIAIPAGPSHFYTKKYTSIKELFATRSEGKSKNLPKNTSKKNIHIFTELPDTNQINEFGIKYFKKNGSDNYLELFPIYIKEPNITKPKSK